MKESGIEWIGEIPDDWDVRKMKYCGELDSNGVDKKQREGEKLYKSIHYMDVYTHSLHEIGNSEDYLVISADDQKAEMCTLKQGDVLLTTSSENPEDIGHSTEISDELDNILFGYHLMRFRATIPLATHLRKYIIGSYLMRQWFEYRSVGMTRYGLSRSDITDAKLILPPFTKQHHIASFLDTKCSLIDSTIEKEREIIEKLKEYRQAVITEAVTKGIRAGVPMKDSGVEWIGEIPVGWSVIKLKWLLQSPLQYGANESGDEYDDELPRYIRITDISQDGQLKEDNKLSLSLEKSQEYLLKEGDVLFARSGATVGKSFLYHDSHGYSAFAGYLIRAKPNQKKLLSELLYYYTQSTNYDEWKNQIFIQATIQNIGGEKYSQLQLVVPPLSEQSHIISYLDAKCSAIDATIQKRELAIEKLTQYKQSLIYECVTGKREVAA